MRRVLLVMTTLCLGACLHTRSVDKGEAETQKHPQGEQVAAPRPVGTRPESVFKPGATRRLQKALSDRGYKVSATGEVDEPTRRALERFQRDNELAPTGFPDLDTVGKLGLDPDSMYLAGSTSKHEDPHKRREHRQAERGQSRQ